MDNLDLLQNTDYSKKLEKFKNSELLHDICVQDVKYLCCQPIDLEIPIPAQSGGPDGGCRGELIPIPPDVTCRVRVTCADEHLKPTCDGVNIQVGFQITLIPPNPQECPVMVVNHIEQFECTVFYRFPTWEPVSGEHLREALKMIDGSCIVTENLSCQIIFDPLCGAKVQIQGCLIDKLWKRENLWVMGWAPFSGTTVKKEFPEPHKIGPCVPCPIATLSDDPNANRVMGSPCPKQK